MRLLEGVRDDVKAITAKANEDMCRKYDKGVKKRQFKLGDVVLMMTRELRSRGQKLKPKWIGPGVVTWLGDQGAAKVRNARGHERIYNVDSLKPYFGIE